MSQPLNWNSRNITHGWQRGATSFYYGLGLTSEDLDRPQVGIGVPLLEGNLCNVHAYQLARTIADGCRTAGLIGFPFGVPGVSDNITQGYEGGNASLPSRNMIANAAECVASAHQYDALVGMHHCDKNGPGFAMALARLNFPGLIVSGGTIMPGCTQGRKTSILDVYDSQAAASVGTIPQAQADEVIRTACPGPGGCGIAASFNTWAVAMEAIGLMLPGSSSRPAIDDSKNTECEQVGQAVRRMLEMGLRPLDVLTRQAFENATAAIAAMGGSTNGVLHLLALAVEAGVDFGLADMQAIFRGTPVVCSFAPRGNQTMVDLHNIGGSPVLLNFLCELGILQKDAITVSGQSLWENVADATERPSDRELLAVDGPSFKSFADMQVCFGNLAPDGIVFKVSSLQAPSFSGPAICFDNARDVQTAVAEGRIQPGHIIVLRYAGPCASGMPEVLVASAALSLPELDGKVALISDTRVSGVSHGAIGVHCSPEAYVGGPIALVRDGDQITFDLLAGECTFNVSNEELAERKANWRRPELPCRRGYLADFAATVSQAHRGCVSTALHGSRP